MCILVASVKIPIAFKLRNAAACVLMVQKVLEIDAGCQDGAREVQLPTLPHVVIFQTVGIEFGVVAAREADGQNC